MAHAFFLGVDFADTEPDAPIDAVLTILEKEKGETDVEASYRLDHARHHTDVDTAEDLADHIQGLVADQPYIGRTSIVVNRASEGGQALVDALKNRGLDPVAATLTAGSGAVPGGRDEVGVQLGTSDAVRTLAELYRDRRFGIDDYATEAASELARGIQRAAERLDEADGNQETPEAAGSTLDGFNEVGPSITSAALAAWVGAERSFDPTQHLKQDPHTTRSDHEAPGA
jgi:hypothetical protein